MSSKISSAGSENRISASKSITQSQNLSSNFASLNTKSNQYQASRKREEGGGVTSQSGFHGLLAASAVSTAYRAGIEAAAGRSAIGMRNEHQTQNGNSKIKLLIQSSVELKHKISDLERQTRVFLEQRAGSLEGTSGNSNNVSPEHRSSLLGNTQNTNTLFFKQKSLQNTSTASGNSSEATPLQGNSRFSNKYAVATAPSLQRLSVDVPRLSLLSTRAAGEQGSPTATVLSAVAAERAAQRETSAAKKNTASQLVKQKIEEKTRQIFGSVQVQSQQSAGSDVRKTSGSSGKNNSTAKMSAESLFSSFTQSLTKSSGSSSFLYYCAPSTSTNETDLTSPKSCTTGNVAREVLRTGSQAKKSRLINDFYQKQQQLSMSCAGDRSEALKQSFRVSSKTQHQVSLELSSQHSEQQSKVLPQSPTLQNSHAEVTVLDQSLGSSILARTQSPHQHSIKSERIEDMVIQQGHKQDVQGQLLSLTQQDESLTQVPLRKLLARVTSALKQSELKQQAWMREKHIIQKMMHEQQQQLVIKDQIIADLQKSLLKK